MPAPLRLLTLGQTGTQVILERGKSYRARIKTPCVPGTGQALRVALLNLGSSFGFPADLQVYESAAALPADWPARRRTVVGACPLFFEARAALDFPIDLQRLRDLAQSFGGTVLDFWEAPNGSILFGEGLPAPPAAPGGQVPPFQTPTTPLPVPGTKPPVTGTSPASSTTQPANLFWLAAAATLMSVVFKVFK